MASNYVVVGRAPGLDLTLDENDFSVLWQASGPSRVCNLPPSVGDRIDLNRLDSCMCPVEYVFYGCRYRLHTRTYSPGIPCFVGL